MIDAKEMNIDPSLWGIDVIHIGQSKTRIVKVKNFFSNPDRVREIALQADLKCTIMGETSYTPGYVGRIGNITTEFFKNFVDIARSNLQPSITILHNPKISMFTIQRYKPGELCMTTSLYPHVDRLHYACVLSLNTNEELSGTDSGTSFCRHIETNMEHTCSDMNYRHDRARNQDRTMVPLDPSTFVREGWETYHTEPHEYNTLLLYEGNVWHTPYFNTNWSCDRITFNGFLK